jgi:hypothetical protein
MKSYLFFLASQVHPDPKLAIACAENYFKNMSIDFHLSSIAFRS